MTNAEKYLKDGISAEEFIEAYLNFSFSRVWGKDENSFENITKKFFEQEVKPQLTEDERVILRNIDEVYTEIDRTSNDYLEVSYKAEDNIRRFYGLPYKHLFQFIAERRTILY